MTFPVGVLLARGVSQSACGFVKTLMAPRAKDRLSAEEALAHVWLKVEGSPEDSSPSGASSLHAINNPTLITIEEQDPVCSDIESLSAENNPFSVASGSWSTFAEEPAEKPDDTMSLPEVPPQDPSGLGQPESSEETIQVVTGQNQPKTVSGGLAPGSLSRNWKQLLQNTDYENFGIYNCPFTGCLFSKGTAFDTSEALVQHISKSHGRINRPPYQCIVNSCPLVSRATFQSPEELATHLRIAHKRGSGIYLCSVKGCQFTQGSGLVSGTALSTHLKNAHSIVQYGDTYPAAMDHLSLHSSTSVVSGTIKKIRLNVMQWHWADDGVECLRKLDALADILRAVEHRQDEIRTTRPWDQSLKSLYPRNNPESALSQLEQAMKNLEAAMAPTNLLPRMLGLDRGLVENIFEQIARNCEKIQCLLDQGKYTPSKR